MPIYSYTAITATGAARESSIEAGSESQARARLQSKGERVLRIAEKSGGAVATAKVSGKKPSMDDVATVIRQMSILIRAGVPLVESIQGLEEGARTPSLQACLRAIALDVSQGTALSDAFARHPSIFPTLAIEMAKVAEAGGNLAEALEKLAEHMDTGAEIGRKVKAALAYPVVVIIISFATVLIMVTFILPRFMKLFDQMGAKLPWTTVMLMNLSHLLTSRWYLFLVGAGVAYYMGRKFARSAAGKRKIDAVVLKLPVVGDIVTKVVISRVVSTMATLLSSGVPMVKTLETSATAANNEIVKEALLKAKRDVAEGSAVSQSLRAANMFPPMVLQMVASGEKTGELPAMLNHVCALYGRETDAKVKSLTSIIEPVMIVILGLIVGFIAISVIVPIYSLVGGVK